MTIKSIPWWQNGVIYQIYPKSFQATEKKSTGDLQGIIRRLDYIQYLGVSAIWLTPVYPSPQVDNGYDVADYCAIDPEYGTMQDFNKLVKEAHHRGLLIMMDMVFNHTSTEHPWFKASKNKESPYRDFYIWRNAKPDGSAPNNWRSKFGGSAWQKDESSQQYYLHLFSPQQADLNWENPNVRTEIKKICQFWADNGVDALRLDVINLVSKQQDFCDDDKGDGRRFYTDGPKIHTYLKELSRDVFNPNKLKTVGEMSSTNLANCQQYSDLNGSELTMTFNFHHLKIDYPNGEKWASATPNFIELKQLVTKWQTGMHNRAWNALFWCNHDQPRIVSRFGNEEKFHTESAKMWAMILYGLQGTPYLYQGEEIGMTNPNFNDISKYRDVESLNIYKEKRAEGLPEREILQLLACKSRDNSRTPMQWDDSKHAGFSKARPWIDIPKNYKHINVNIALKNPDSILYCYQTLIALRKSYTIFTYGDYRDLTPNNASVWSYLRTEKNQRLLVIANLADEATTWRCPEWLVRGNCFKLLLSNYAYHSPQIIRLIQLQPYEACYWLQENSSTE